MDTNCVTFKQIRFDLQKRGFKNTKIKQAFQNMAQIHDFLTVYCYETEAVKKAKDQIVTAFVLVEAAILADLIPTAEIETQEVFDFMTENRPKKGSDVSI